MPLPGELLHDLERRTKAGDALADARQRLDVLFERGTFQEYGRFADHALPAADRKAASFPGDGVVTGVGYVGARPAAAFAQSLQIASGSLGRAHADKIAGIVDHAGKAGMPVVGFLSSVGGRLEEGMEALAGHGAILGRMANLSGVVPQVIVVAGPCPGAAAMIAGLADFVIMVRDRAALYLSGPEVIERVGGGLATAEELGGAGTHAGVSGLAHFAVADDAEAAALVRRLLGFLPANNAAPPPDRDEAALDVGSDEGMDALAPGSLEEPLDIRPILTRLADGGDWLEIQPAYGSSLVAGFGRIGGLVSGLVASQAGERAGVLDLAACAKAARFVRFCDAFGIPVVTLVDSPGFLPGLDQERGGLVREAARLAFAYAEATVPKVTVVVRKAFGGAYLALGSRPLGADVVFAWPTADIGLSGGDGERDVEARYPAPYLRDGRFTVADVIAPSRTRGAVALALRSLASKRELRPPRKHGTLAP